MLESLGDAVAVGKALAAVGWANVIGNPELARGAFVRSIEATREANDDAFLMGDLQGLSLALLHLGRLDEARQAALEAVEVGDRAEDPYTNGINYMTLGAVELRLGNMRAGAEDFTEALRRSVAAGSLMNISIALDGMAMIAIPLGDLHGAVRVAGAAERMRRQIGGAPSMEMVGAEAPLVIARRMLPAEEYERALNEGRALSDAEAAALGLEIASAAAGRAPRPAR